MTRKNLKRIARRFSRNVAYSYIRRKPEDAFREVLSTLGYNNYVGGETGEEYFVRNVISKINPKLSLDIGANRGSYSRLLLEATEGNVIAFEPLPIMREALESLRLAFPDRIRLEACGVGDKLDELEINYSVNTSSHASFLSEVGKIDYIENAQKTTVPIISLDEYANNSKLEDIDFIKIDVEGFEGRVLDGARELIARRPPKAFQIEYNVHQLLTQESIYSFSRRLPGYDVFQLLPKSIVRRDPISSEANVFAFSNFAFIRRDIAASIKI